MQVKGHSTGSSISVILYSKEIVGDVTFKIYGYDYDQKQNLKHGAVILYRKELITFEPKRKQKLLLVIITSKSRKPNNVPK